METTARRTRPALAALALALPLVAAGVPATAAPNEVVYDALGDSYASGAGSGPLGACGQSDVAYPERLDGRMRIDLDDDATCAGATAAPDPNPTAFNNVFSEQLWALDHDTDLVTITIGGNDIGWSQAVVACLFSVDAQCAGAVGQAGLAIQNVLPARLDAAYAAVHEVAPNAHVVVTGYPRLFSPEYGDYAGVLPVGPGLPYLVSTTEQNYLNNGADLLNSMIAAKAAQHGFQYVDVTAKFAGHGINAPEAWITGILHPVQFHPTADGQDAYAAAVTAAINPRDLR